MSQENPFQSPLAAAAPTDAAEAVDGFEIASSDRRLLNLFLDFIGYEVLAFLLGAGSALLGVSDLLAAFPDLVFGIVLISTYYIGQEALWGKTLGKWITGTKVVNQDGGRPSWGQIVGRTLCRFIPFEAFSFLGKQPVGWHDKLSNTRVIRER